MLARAYYTRCAARVRDTKTNFRRTTKGICFASIEQTEKSTSFRIHVFHELLERFRILHDFQIRIRRYRGKIIETVVVGFAQKHHSLFDIFQIGASARHVVVRRLFFELVHGPNFLSLRAAGGTSDGRGSWYVFGTNDVDLRSWKFEGLFEHFEGFRVHVFLHQPKTQYFSFAKRRGRGPLLSWLLLDLVVALGRRDARRLCPLTRDDARMWLCLMPKRTRVET